MAGGDMTGELATMDRPTAGLAIDRDAVLRTLNLNPRDANTQALLLVCERYGLDPLLKHMVLIQGRPYVTRDGYLSVAHASGALDGIEILDEGEDRDHWWAKVAVYRKDMSRPFTYRGRYPKSGGNKQYGPEMAIKCAEVAALRRAFNVTGIGAADEKWDDIDDEHTVAPAPTDRTERYEANSALNARLNTASAEVRAGLVAWKTEYKPAFETGLGYSVEDVDRINAELDRLEAQDVGAGVGDPLAGGSAAAPAPDDPAQEAADLASTPCALCGSTRSTRVLGAGHAVLCRNTKDCAERVEQQKPF